MSLFLFMLEKKKFISEENYNLCLRMSIQMQNLDFSAFLIQEMQLRGFMTYNESLDQFILLYQDKYEKNKKEFLSENQDSTENILF